MTQTVVRNGYSDISQLNLETIRIFGANSTIDTVMVNGEAHNDFILSSNEVYVHNLKLPVNSRYTITFTTKSNSNSAASLFGLGSILFYVTFLLSLFA